MFHIDFLDAGVRASLLEFVPERYRSDCVLFLGGSLVEGFGNSTSDIDIIAVVDGKLDGSLSEHTSFSTLAAPGMEIHLGTYRNIRVDLEVLSVNIFKKVSSELLAGAGAGVVPNFLRPTINNLKIGIALQHEEEFARLRDGFPWLAYSEALVREAAGRFNGPSDDAVGAIQSKDIGAAIHTSRYAMDSASEAYLASLGNTNLRAKWRLRMFERYAEPTIVQNFLASLLEESLDPQHVSVTARRRLQAAQSLLIEAHENVRKRRHAAEEQSKRPRRELSITGFANARDMGGVPIGSASIRYGVLIRAGRNTAAQPGELPHLGIQQVIDLRSEDERSAVPPVDVEGVATLSLPQPTFDAEQTVRALEAIASSDGGVLVHCVMGRDRTSLLVSSLLAVLGGSRRIIVDEYMHAVHGWDIASGQDDRSSKTYARVEREFEVAMSDADLVGQLRTAGLSATTIRLLSSRLLVHGEQAPEKNHEKIGEVNVQAS
jgi:hypothetical protein